MSRLTRTVPAVMVTVLPTAVLSQRLPVGERLVHRGTAGDRRTHLLRHLGTEVGEFRDVDELHTHRRAGLQTWVGRVGFLDRLQRGLAEGGRGLLVIGHRVGRGALAGRYPGPAELLPVQLLVVLAGGPEDELRGR